MGSNVHSAIIALVTCACAASCSTPGPSSDGALDASDATDTAPAPVPDWTLAVDPSVRAEHVTPALLGHYDLSGALQNFDSNSALRDRLRAIGFSDWRVGAGRWEIATQLLPTRTDGTSCAGALTGFPAALRAPAGATDLTLTMARDWFTDTGTAVSHADTQDDSRYALTYVRSVIDVATALGATPFVDIDLMPRALSRNRTFSRVGAIQGVSDPCLATFSNEVSNAPPADPDVFAAAARGLVQRVVEGSSGEPGRPVAYWEVWNEPDLGYAWTGTIDEYFAMALRVVVQLDAYRAASTHPGARAIHIGLGSFAFAPTAVAMLRALDARPLPGGAHAPIDFVSFHAYDNDPLVVLEALRTVASARDASTHYRNVELVLAEWGPFLDARAPASDSMETGLLVATVLARAPALGVTRTHRSLVVDLAPGMDIPYAPLATDGTPKPLYHAYELLHALVEGGGERLPITGAPDGAFAGGLGAALVLEAGGTERALVVNRDTQSHTVGLSVAGVRTSFTRVLVFDAPGSAPHDAPAGAVVRVPAGAMAVLWSSR